MSKKILEKSLEGMFGLTVNARKQVVTTIIETLIEVIKENESFSLMGLGKFYHTTLKPRKCFNPRTKQFIMSKEKQKIRFKSFIK